MVIAATNKQLPEKFHFINVRDAVRDANDSILKIKNKAFQRKLNGTAAEIFKNDETRIFGRGVLEYGILSEYSNRFPEIVDAIKKLEIPKDTDFVGELVVINPNTGFESLELVLTRSQRSFATNDHIRCYPAILVILDVVRVNGKDVKLLKYLDRIEALKNSVKDWSKGEGKIIFIKSSNQFNWDYIETNKLEGIVIRDLDATYNKGIWKLKREITEDVYCKGEYNKSESMVDLFSSLICYQLDQNGKEVFVADVGGGFTDKERKDMQEILNSGIMKKYPLVIEIKSNGRTSSGKFLNPIFKRKRYDKAWNQCIMG
jgi:ATP-dependent DNA ligase